MTVVSIENLGSLSHNDLQYLVDSFNLLFHYTVSSNHVSSLSQQFGCSYQIDKGNSELRSLKSKSCHFSNFDVFSNIQKSVFDLHVLNKWFHDENKTHTHIYIYSIIHNDTIITGWVFIGLNDAQNAKTEPSYLVKKVGLGMDQVIVKMNWVYMSSNMFC